MPIPKRTIYRSEGVPDARKLLNARHQLCVGDVFYRVEKHVVKKITITEGSKDLDVESEITKSSWQLYP